MPRTKTCSLCRTEQPIDAFYRRRSGESERRPECKACTREQQKTARGRGKVARHRPGARSQTAGRSLSQFTQAKKRENCRVCRLPGKVRNELREARERRSHSRHVLLEWLRTDYDAQITTEDLDTHIRQRHDAR